ncbi:hypothetical protein Tco_0692601 [Tanacetum coccineum]
MVVQNQSELGKGSAMPTDPHHTPTILQPTSQPQKKQKHRKHKRKDTQVPQSSVPTENVADEVVHKELGDSLVRAATTASSLEAEQDSGNITKTYGNIHILYLEYDVLVFSGYGVLNCSLGSWDECRRIRSISCDWDTAYWLSE